MVHGCRAGIMLICECIKYIYQYLLVLQKLILCYAKLTLSISTVVFTRAVLLDTDYF